MDEWNFSIIYTNEDIVEHFYSCLRQGTVTLEHFSFKRWVIFLSKEIFHM